MTSSGLSSIEASDCLSRDCSSSFITLIPEVKEPPTLSDYCPISLICCFHKIISNALAARLKRVIGYVIEEVQTSFIEGRDILDGPMIINEIGGWAKWTKRCTFLLKVDFHKAFDSINWIFLDLVMSKMGFGNRWRF